MTSTKTNDISVTAYDTALSPQHDFTTAKRTGKDVEHPSSDDEISREAALTALTVDEERRLIRRVDWRLVPLLCMLYLMKKIDENNVSTFNGENERVTADRSRLRMRES